jgi:hypothetical protein
MRAFLQEPLLHFLLLGTAVFAAYDFLNRALKADQGEIVVGAGQIEHLAARFAQFQQRSPTAEELKGLIDQYVREEVLSREAVKLGLDQDDSVIRRRLQQKMEFVATDLAAIEEPTDAELADWLAKHPDDFRQPARYTFRHVFLSPDKRRDAIDSDVSKLLASLKHAGAQADADKLGDSLLLPHEFAGESHSAVASQFGREFAEQLAELKMGEWTGPIRSGFGVHFVLLTARTDSRLPEVDEVRELVRRDLMNVRRLEVNRRFLEGLLARYKVKVEWPPTYFVSADTMVARAP